MPHKNPEDSKVYQKAYREAHRAESKAYDKAYQEAHKAEKKAYQQAYHQAHKAKKNAYSRDYNKVNDQYLRQTALNAYGGTICICCGESHNEFLTIDHIAGDGAEHRRQSGVGSHLYRWLRNNGYPPGFRVLCMNCNFSLGKYGYCPHGNVKIEKEQCVISRQDNLQGTLWD